MAKAERDPGPGGGAGWGDLLARCRADPEIERVEIDGFAFPLGAYPVPEERDQIKPRPGYTVAFEPADGDEEGEWEEWPDRYVYDVLVPAGRVEALCRTLFALLPGRVYPILDVLGHDAFREVDPYVSYDLVGQERFLEAVRRYRDFLFEDGLVGFGAMSEEPFLYIFLDEHKIVTVRAEATLQNRVEAVLAAFDLELVETLSGADATTHEHRGVLLAPDDRPELLTADEIIEQLCDQWRLTLNIDPETNLDDEGQELGVTAWRCVVRGDPLDEPAESEETEENPEPDAAAASEPNKPRPYAEILLTADCLRDVERLVLETWDELEGASGLEPRILIADRIAPEPFAKALEEAGQTPDLAEIRVWQASWLDGS
jgi:hypothetical protein